MSKIVSSRMNRQSPAPLVAVVFLLVLIGTPTPTIGESINGATVRGETPSASMSTSSALLLVPIAVNATGANGVSFKTDLTIRNRRNLRQRVRLVFEPAGRDNFNEDEAWSERTFDPGETVTIEDVVSKLFLPDGFGSVRILGWTEDAFDPNAQLVASFRIRSSIPGKAGTTSQSAAATDLQHSVVTTGATATGLVQNSSQRTNVGVANCDYGEHTFRVHATGERSEATIELRVPPFSVGQVPLPAGDFGRLQLRFEPADQETAFFVGYGSSVDEVSGDAWLQMAVPDRSLDAMTENHPAASLIIPVAGSLPGANGTFFRTDLDLTNHGNQPRRVSVSYFADGYYLDPGETIVADIDLPPHATVTYPDVAANVLGNQGVVGAIVINDPSFGFNPDVTLDATYRIYTSGREGGEMSQASSALDYFALSTTDQTLVAIGLLLNRDYRCNVGIFNSSRSADRSFRVTAIPESGSDVVTFTVNVPAARLVQVPIPAESLGHFSVTIEPLDLQLGQRWSAYATSIDNRSGDSWLAVAAPE